MSSAALSAARFSSEGGWADLSGRLQLKLTGADRVRYLNGQVTANVQRLEPGKALPACVTTAKGRLCGDVFIHATADALWIDAEASLRETLPARLERYIIADDAVLAEVGGEVGLLHLMGPLASRPIDPDAVLAVAQANRFGEPGLDVLLPAGALDGFRAGLAAEMPELDAAFLEGLRVAAGIPRWGFELDEHTLPPEAGLERTHIDYHKGCYIGQEVISRLKSIGHVNRRLVRLTAEGPAPLEAGLVLHPSEPGAPAAGVITSAAWSFALDRPMGLGYLKRAVPCGVLLARAADAPAGGRPVQAQELPSHP